MRYALTRIESARRLFVRALGASIALAGAGLCAEEGELPVPAPRFVHLSNAASYDAEGFFAQDALHDAWGADRSDLDTYDAISGFEGDALSPLGWRGAGDIRTVRIRPATAADAIEIEVTLANRQVTIADPLYEFRPSRDPRGVGSPLVDEPIPPVPGVSGARVEPLPQVVFIGIDDRAGGFERWPHEAGVATPGLDRGFTISFDGFATVSTGGPPQAVPARIEAHSATIVIDRIASRTPRFVVGAGEWDSHASTWAARPTPMPRVLDLALSCPLHLRPEIPAPARDDTACEWAQSADLGAAHTGHSWFEVDLDRLGQALPAPAPDRGWVSYVYRSAVDNGDGYFVATSAQFLGPWQSVTVGLPDEWHARSSDLVVYLHGAAPWGTQQTAREGWSSALVDSGRIVAYPHGRGGASWWFGAGEVDVFETIATVEGIAPIDPDRRVLSGVSGGGFGTYHLASGHPDLFAGAIVYQGANTTGPCSTTAWSGCPFWSSDEVIASTWNLPILLLSGTETAYADMETRRQTLDTLGHEHRFLLFPDPEHSAAFPSRVNAHAVSWLDGLGPRVHDPHDIRYRWAPFWVASPTDHPYFDGEGLVARDAVYWLSGLEAREGVEVAALRASSDAIFERAIRTEEPYGPTPVTEGDEPTPYTERGRDVAWSPGLPAQAARLELEGVATVVLDLDRMRLLPGAMIEVGTDGPVTVRSIGDRLCGDTGGCALEAGTHGLVVE